MIRTPALAAAFAVASMTAIRLVRDVRDSLGAPTSDITARTAVSDACVDGVFGNEEPSSVVRSRSSWPAIVVGLLRRAFVGGSHVPIPVETPNFPATADELAVTWCGHASVMVEVDGHTILTDPMWSTYVSPTQLFGLRRAHPAPVPLSDLPRLDAIVISHDHFDHLDAASVRELARVSRAPFLVPLGVGAHLRTWGIAASRIVELDWWQDVEIGELRLTCTPARHYSGRTVLSNNTLWASWSIVGPSRAVFFAGDTGPTSLHAEIARRIGPFDLTLLPIGAYDDDWPDIHINPTQALAAHAVLGQATSSLLPIHWGTFALAPHPWAEPIEWLVTDADSSTSILIPVPGERVVVDDAIGPGEAFVRWWEQPDDAR